jgi:hypothetical protein
MNWFYWRWLRIRRRFYARDLLSLLALSTAIVLAVQGKDQKIALPLLAAYMVFTGWRWWLTLRSREARDLTMATAVGGLFHQINTQVFASSQCTRFTLFQEAPFRSCIVPICRYRRNGREPITEAEASRSWYRRGEGITGRAWDGPSNEFDVQVLPDFENKRGVMEAYYLHHLQVPKPRLQAISDYMVRVRGIVSYTFANSREQQLGLMSIDIADAEVLFDKEDGTITVVPNAGASPFLVDLDHLSLLSSMIGNVLESFDLAGRRISYE